MSFKTVVDMPGDEFWEKAFRCYGCNEVHTLQIFYCESSHFLCQKCAKLVKCECGSKPTKIRAPFLENIVRRSRFVCPNQCGFTLTNDEYAHHLEVACRRRNIACVYCNIPQEYTDYLHHLRRIHIIPKVELDDSGSVSLLLRADTPTVQHVMFQGKNYFIRWKNLRFWIQNYDNTTRVVVHLKKDSYEHKLQPARLHTYFSEVDHAKLTENETYTITFQEETEKVAVITRHSDDGKWEVVLREKTGTPTPKSVTHTYQF